ncbi:MAG TPA: coniferyl aldehyde dehydrogenase [Gemmatimonadales bacterium]|jgi:coniferyl-aldehyde dehydrogenase
MSTTPIRPDPPPQEGRGEALVEMHRLYEVQRRACASSPAPDLRARLRSLASLAQTIDENSPAIAKAISEDFGNRSVHETYLLELVPLQNAIRHATRNLARWMRPERRRVPWVFGVNASWVQYQPLGVVGIVSPWNYPLSLSLIPTLDALAAGNRVLLKPSELTPAFSRLLQRLLAERFAEEELAVVLGGVDVAEQFIRLPLDHLLFTGSTAVGRQVMAAAAEHLTPVTLELGGKSPVVICPDYDVHAAARDITFPKLANAGQTCVAPDYALAPTAKTRALSEAVIAEARRLFPSISSNSSYTSILNDRHYHRLRNALDEARAGGAEILSCGDEPAARRMGLAVVLNPPLDCALMRDEIFGPVLPIVSYETLDEAIAFIRQRDKPLALYCLTHDLGYREAVLDRTISGGVTINGAFLHQAQENIPFGGVGRSGIGAYHGEAGFRRFSHARSVHQVRLFNVVNLAAPPYGRVARRMIRVLGSRRAADSC